VLNSVDRRQHIAAHFTVRDLQKELFKPSKNIAPARLAVVPIRKGGWPTPD
tara:strand:+ start:265 stop:417 length:153 start_codon:yes stop_codon:yes gene_type:complete